MTMMWVDVEGGRLYVRESGNGSPIVLLHGWALDHRIFEPQLDDFSRSFRVVAFDRRGFGRSRAPPDLRRETDDIDSVLEALSIDSAHLLGMSQGARIALRFAVTRPARLRSLILQGPAVDGVALEEVGGERIPIAEFAGLAQAGRLDEVRRRWLAHPMMSLADEHAVMRRFLGTIVSAYRGADLLDYAPGSDLFPHARDMLARLGRVSVPALIMTGAGETSVRRAHAQKLLGAMPACREVVFARSGHLSNLTEPEAYNRQVVGFCAGVDERLRSCARD